MFDRIHSFSSKRFVIATVVFAIAIGSILILRRFEPSGASFYPKCVFYQVTGFHCPGCGGTRAMHALAMGDWFLAVQCNALLILGSPIILAVVVWIRKYRHALGSPGFRAFTWTIFVVVALFSIARNLPSPTTSPLAPPAANLTQ